MSKNIRSNLAVKSFGGLSELVLAEGSFVPEAVGRGTKVVRVHNNMDVVPTCTNK